MKDYKSRIQHSCGFPEPLIKESHIMKPAQVYQSDVFHNFTCEPFQDSYGIGYAFTCDKALTSYRVIVSGCGVYTLGIAHRGGVFCTVSAQMDGHKRLIEGCKLLKANK